MISRRWVRDLLQEEWSKSQSPVDGKGTIRDKLDERPEFVRHGNSGRRTQSTRGSPIVYIDSEGETTREPYSVGYRDERVETEFIIEIAWFGSEEELVGTPDEEYGGYAGEFKRIMHKHRKGLVESDVSVVNPGFDLIMVERVMDDAEKRGADEWTVEWSIRFITFADKVLVK